MPSVYRCEYACGYSTIMGVLAAQVEVRRMEEGAQ